MRLRVRIIFLSLSFFSLLLYIVLFLATLLLFLATLLLFLATPVVSNNTIATCNSTPSIIDRSRLDNGPMERNEIRAVRSGFCMGFIELSPRFLAKEQTRGKKCNVKCTKFAKSFAFSRVFYNLFAYFKKILYLCIGI